MSDEEGRINKKENDEEKNDTITKQKKNREIQSVGVWIWNKLPNKQARSEAICRAIRIIVNEAHYPTYSFPSCHSY